MSPTRRFWLEWLGVFAACAALCALFQFMTPYLPEEDCYYHVKFAWLLRHHGFFRSGFPWGAFSLLKDGFSDGSVLFHLYLIPFTFGDLAFGGKLAGVFLSAFMFSSFFAILTLNRVRARFYWLWILLLGGGYFWFRMLDVRPQVLSAALLLWSLHFLVNGKRKGFALLSFLYPLSYVAAFLPQIFSVVRWVYLKVVEERDERAMVFAGLAAYGFAMMVHPYFPKNLTFFYVQNVYAMYLSMTQKVNLYMGGELLPLNTRDFVGAHAVLIAHLFAAAFVFMHRRIALSERTRVMSLIAPIAILLTCGSKRFVEYSVPATTLYCAFLFDDLLAGWDLERFHARYGTLGRAVVIAWICALAGASGVQADTISRDYAHLPPPHFKDLATFLAANAPAGETIFTCDWDEPPELLFYNSQHHYLNLMDPTFMYYWDKKVWKTWFETSNGQLTADETVKALDGTFHSRFGLCGAKFGAFRRLIGADPRFRILAENQHGYVFELQKDTLP